MEQADLADSLRRHGVDVSSLAPVFSRGDEWIYQLMVPAESAVAQWQLLRDLVPETGYWPVVGWGIRWLDNNAWYVRHLHSSSTADILADSERIDLDRWRDDQARAWAEILQEDGESVESSDDPLYDVRGEWPGDVAPISAFYTPTKYATRDPVPLVPIALAPATAGWQVPAVLRFAMGAASPAVHAAMLRRWETSHSAELVCMLPDLMEMRISRPPTTRGDALALAEEQFVYCRDIVIQGTETIEALAASLLNGTVWFFWWD
jgi:uncharacterized protein DUF4253